MNQIKINTHTLNLKIMELIQPSYLRIHKSSFDVLDINLCTKISLCRYLNSRFGYFRTLYVISMEYKRRSIDLITYAYPISMKQKCKIHKKYIFMNPRNDRPFSV